MQLRRCSSGLLGLTPDELMHELASEGGAVDLRAALD